MGEDWLRAKDLFYQVKSERCRDFELRQLRLGQEVPFVERAEVAAELTAPVAAGELVVLTFPEPGGATLHCGRRQVGSLPAEATESARRFANGAVAIAAAVAPAATPSEGACKVFLFKKKGQ